jgi:hypothetical protein
VEDWRYDSLRADIKQLRDNLSGVERRTWKVEHWQSFVPIWICIGLCWLMIIGMWIALIADAAGAF